MVALAEWHAAARCFPGEGWFRSEVNAQSPAVASRFRILEAWIHRDLAAIERRIASADESSFRDIADRILAAARRIGTRLLAELRDVQELRVEVQPVLRDIWHDHVLFDGDTVSGFIDPCAASTDTISTDLSRLVGSLIAENKRARQIALDTYASVRNLTLSEHALFRALDRSGVLLSSLTWLRRRYLEHVQFDESRVLARLKPQAGRLEELCDE